ncbi:MAG: 16S rRNA (guanine(966)-N(2))-methyltransferase RsmD [Clostridiales bacterium]|jgi:16S rRNA (guanine(966)-N(2))-methyltransferase RsmD|nr:16S rRNA (guanine(966)-N(2))-methyltransferase RsmD [Clostridiales bacterium]
MRIISGKYRGKKLLFPKSDSVRPTTGKTKEALFSILQFEIFGSDVLDLFAGSGAIGIECLSRGANRAVFADADAAYVKKNLELTGEKGREVIEADYDAVLKRLAGRGDKFDFIFLDPPYAGDAGEKAVKLIARYGLLKKGGKIIFEHSRGKDLKDLNECATIYDNRTYGTQALSFLSLD